MDLMTLCHLGLHRWHLSGFNLLLLVLLVLLIIDPIVAMRVSVQSLVHALVT